MVLAPGELETIFALAMPAEIATVLGEPPPTNVAEPEVMVKSTEPLEASSQPRPSST